MNTYVKIESSQNFAAVRATRAEIKKRDAALFETIVPATKSLREMARRRSIPTLVFLADGRLSQL